MNERERSMCEDLYDATRNASETWEWRDHRVDDDGSLVIKDDKGRVFRITATEIAE